MNGRTTWLGKDPDDMPWLIDVYSAPQGVKCAILYGNEDDAEKIDAWFTYNPHFETPPDWTSTRPPEPDLD